MIVTEDRGLRPVHKQDLVERGNGEGLYQAWLLTLIASVPSHQHTTARQASYCTNPPPRALNLSDSYNLHSTLPLDVANTMGLFSRRAAPAATHTTDAAGEPMTTNGTNGHHHEKSGRGSIFNKHDRAAAPRHHQNYSHNGPFNRRPTFGQWLKATWIDLLTMVAMGLLGLGVSNVLKESEIHTDKQPADLRSEASPITLICCLFPRR